MTFWGYDILKIDHAFVKPFKAVLCLKNNSLIVQTDCSLQTYERARKHVQT